MGLSDRREPIAALPFLRELGEQAMAGLFRFGRFDERERFTAREFQQFKITKRVGDMKAKFAVLSRSEKFAGAANV